MSERDRLNKLLQQIGITTKDEALAQAIQELSDEEKIRLFSQIAPYEDDPLALILTIADRYEISWLKDFIEEKLKLRVSLNRLGRREFVHIVSEGRKEEKKGLRERLARKKEEEKP